MINKRQFGSLIGRTLDMMPYRVTPEVVSLIMGTAAQESQFGHFIYQVSSGPALGIFQMEPETETDCWANFIYARQDLKSAIFRVTGRTGPGPWLEWDMAYQIMLCRVRYRRSKGAIPVDVLGQAQYWKTNYNTNAGQGTVQEYLNNYRRFVGNR